MIQPGNEKLNKYRGMKKLKIFFYKINKNQLQISNLQCRKFLENVKTMRVFIRQ